MNAFRHVPRCFALGLAWAAGRVLAVDVPVNDTAGLAAAIADAAPGHRILLAPGLYTPAGNLVCDAVGTAAEPIQVRAVTPGTATVRLAASGNDIAEGFRVLAPHWQFRDLVLEGACADHSNCEHAFHLAGNADFTVIAGNVLRDFNAQIKSNGSGGEFPDDVLIEGNLFYDGAPRITTRPVTKIDVVGGRRWVVRGNTLRDFAKALSDTVSYGAFLKGGSRSGVFERNLVECSRQHDGGVRIGLSFGGGGTAPAAACEENDCDPEHLDGTMRNNLVLDCSDVGIYLNRSAATRLFHNTLYATSGIDFRYASSSGMAVNNVLSGALRNRDGATGTQTSNRVQVAPALFAQWFVAPAQGDFRLLDGSALRGQAVATAPTTPDDFCGNLRDDGAPDLGALEYDDDFACRTDTGGGDRARLFGDGFEG